MIIPTQAKFTTIHVGWTLILAVKKYIQHLSVLWMENPAVFNLSNSTKTDQEKY